MEYSARLFLICSILTGVTASSHTEYYRPARVSPPSVRREFRGLWITTINNACWPSQPGLTAEKQQAELVYLLGKAAESRFNAVMLQVRPACDAFYQSRFEPWSEFLSGTSGVPPKPFYDPLAFAIEECHKRGLELYAWINPFRAWHPAYRTSIPAGHIARQRPDLVRKYGPYLWLDPGEPDTQQYVLSVIEDLLRRYDIDGIIFDDYFYPYPQKGEGGQKLAFPDKDSYRKYGKGLSLDEWRRRNIDQFVQRVNKLIIVNKPWVKFGISPFGIWRPDNPKGVQGLDAFVELAADSRGWLRKGWVDFLAPQLYWRSDSPKQNYTALVKWWAGQNSAHRHLCVGLNALKALEDWPYQEIASQIYVARAAQTHGQLLFDARILLATNQSLVRHLRTAVYQEPALPPAVTWRINSRPPPPKVQIDAVKKTISLQIPQNLRVPLALWIIQKSSGGRKEWSLEILPVSVTNVSLGNSLPEMIAVRLVDRLGRTSDPSGFRLVR